MFGIQDTQHEMKGILDKIADEINRVSPKLIFKDNDSFLVLKDGWAFRVRTSDMSCSCGDNKYWRGTSSIYGMCCHLAHVVYYSTDPELIELKSLSDGLLRKHVECNTSQPVPSLYQLKQQTLQGHSVKILRHCESFIYVSHLGITYSYYQPGLFWCCAPTPPEESIASELEILVLESIWKIDLPTPKKFELIATDYSCDSYKVKFLCKESESDHFKEIENITATFQLPKKLKVVTIYLQVGKQSFLLKYHKEHGSYTKKGLALLPMALQKKYLPLLTSALSNKTGI